MFERTMLAMIATAAVGFGLVGSASATGTVTVKGSTFVCQTSCIVSYSPAGILQVSDSAGGWVMLVRSRIVVPGN